MLLHTIPFFSATQKVNSWRTFWPIFGDSFAILQVSKAFFLVCMSSTLLLFVNLEMCFMKEGKLAWGLINYDRIFEQTISFKGRTEWRVKSCYSLCPSVGYKEVRLFSILHSQEVKQIHLLAYVFWTATLKYFTHPSQETKEQKCETEA